jgi:hypothetical protein
MASILLFEQGTFAQKSVFSMINIEGISALRKKVVLDPSRRLHENLDIGAKFYLQSHMPKLV